MRSTGRTRPAAGASRLSTLWWAIPVSSRAGRSGLTGTSMSMRIAALILMLIAVPAAGQQDGGSAGPTARATMLATLARGKEMKGSGARYQHLTQVGAVAAGDDETAGQALARIGENGAQVVETKGRLVLFRSARTRPAAVASAGDSSV